MDLSTLKLNANTITCNVKHPLPKHNNINPIQRKHNV
jgi:hypothetical protein